MEVEPAVYRLALAGGGEAGARARRQNVTVDRSRIAVQAASSRSCERVNPRLFVAVRTADDALTRSIARERMVAATSGFFGLAGLALAGIGLFGVAASAVAHRTSELGLRLALGASRWNVVREALRGTALVFAGGLAAGIAAVAIASRADRSPRRRTC